VCECELTNDLETRLLTRMKWTSKFSIDHTITIQFTARPSQPITSISWNHITLKIIIMVIDIKVLDFSSYHKIFKDISSYKGDVRSRYMFTKVSWGNNLKHDDGWFSLCWHVSKKVVFRSLYLNITKELRMRSVWMWID